MGRLFSLLSFAFLAVPAEFFLQQQPEKKVQPPVNWSRSHNIDVKHIVIDLAFNWQKKFAYGSAAITLSLFNRAGTVNLDAGMLTIHSVKLNNGTPLKFNFDGGDKNDGLQISLDHEYGAGEALTLIIGYQTNYLNESDPNTLGGSFGKGIRFLGPTTTEPNKRRQAWSMGDPESNRYWFPCYDSPNDLRTTELIATVDKELTVISNGNMLPVVTLPNGMKRFHFKTSKPYANYLTAFVVGEYVDVKQSYNNIPLHSLHYPDELEAAKSTVVRLPDMAKYFSTVTGINYPYESYTQVFVQDFAGLVGNNSFSTITENMIDDDRTHADFFYLWDLTEAEALAQQWFGNLIPCSDWSEVWLSKSFAHYFNELYNEQRNGREEFLLYQHLFDLNSVYLPDWNAGNRHPVVTKNYESAWTFTGDNYPTGRGALVLHMLRKHLGEQNWWKAIRLYVKANAGRMVTTEDFRKAVEEASGEPMDWFFDQWVYKMGHPVFEVTKSFDQEKKRLTVTVKQLQKTDPDDSYPQAGLFKGKIQIEIDNRIDEVWMEAKAENHFTFDSVQEPKLVNFDFETTWISETKFEKSIGEWIYQLLNDKDITGRRRALTELVAVAGNQHTAADDKAKIYAALRDLIGSHSYWRIRFNALSSLQALLAPPTQNLPASLDEPTIRMLLETIEHDTAWIRTAAINFLGMTKDEKYTQLYLQALNDKSDRVINAAANALGKTKSPLAFDALVKLIRKPSWKNQSLISALNGLRNLGDDRAVDIAFSALKDRHAPHWTLATPVWDYRIAAAQTLVALGKQDMAYTMIRERFDRSMEENDVNDIFSNLLLMTTLADERSKDVFDLLKAKFKNDANAMNAVNQYESMFNDALKK